MSDDAVPQTNGAADAEKVVVEEQVEAPAPPAEEPTAITSPTEPPQPFSWL